MAGDKFDIESNNTLDRREMQCPRCFEYRLQEDAELARELSGQRDTVIYATNCANEACPVDRVDPEDIRKQTPSQNFIQRFSSDYGVMATLIIAVVVGVVILSGVVLSGLAGPDQPADVTISVIGGDDRVSVENVEVTLGDETQTTDSNGRVTFEDRPPNSTHELLLHPDPNGPHAAPVPSTVTITDGSFRIENDQLDIGRPGGTIAQVVLPEPIEVSETAHGSTVDIPLYFTNAVNAKRGVDVTLHGALQADETQTIPLEHHVDNDVTMIVGGATEGETVTVTVPVASETITDEETYSARTNLQLEGETQTDVSITVEPVNGTYPAIQIGETECSSSAVAASGGTCTVDAEFDGVVPLSMEGVSGDVPYELSYSANAVPESVTVQVNGDSYVLDREDGTVNADGSWVGEVSVSGLQEGENTVGIRTSRVEGVRTTVSGEFSYTLSEGLPETPTIRVQDADGQYQTMDVPESELSSGVLVGSYSTTLDPAWFTDGENTVQVRTDSGSVRVDMSASVLDSPEHVSGE